MQPSASGGSANKPKWSHGEAAPFSPAEGQWWTPLLQRRPRTLWLIGIRGFYVVELGSSVIESMAQTVFAWPGGAPHVLYSPCLRS